MGMKWNWPETDLRRAERARSIKVLSIDRVNCSLESIGSSGEVYKTSLNTCTCRDFTCRRTVCKHIIRLAMELGILNEFGRTEEQQRAAEIADSQNKLALWYGYYHLFHTSVATDAEYDSLKQKLVDKYGFSFPDSSLVFDDKKSDALSFVRTYLSSHNLEYVDMSSQGGSLYFFDEKAAEALKAAGLGILYAAQGSRSTKHRPAWYLKLGGTTP